jgi:DNA-binding transcriptional ArsR family regulator/ubiquinone/menaquinone biosynthesis C-methylase UbiE
VARNGSRPLPGSSYSTAADRWELYRLLADPIRPRLLALAAHEELAIGELAELLRESQPKISRHAAALREAGLLAARKQGTWTLLRLAPHADEDAVVNDAVASGMSACEADGTVARIEDVLRARDAATREFFAREGRPLKAGPPDELAAYLAALAPLLPHRSLAVDAGTGDGSLLEVLAPVFQRVIALDRSPAQLELAEARVRRRGFTNVELIQSELGDPKVEELCAQKGGADAVFATRVLHHAGTPSLAVSALVKLARSSPASRSEGARGGAVCILDYEAHDDQNLREQQADIWLGFEPAALKRMAEDAGLIDIHLRSLPASWQGEGPDRHLPWQVLVGWRRPRAAANDAQTKAD